MRMSDLTKDCGRYDCSLLCEWQKTYDKHGNITDPSNPYVYTTRCRCTSCGIAWVLNTDHDETTARLKRVPMAVRLSQWLRRNG